MARLTAYVLALLVLCTGPVAAAGLDCDDRQQKLHDGKQKPHEGKSPDSKEQRDRFKWWIHDRPELGITDQQSKQIDQIFESVVPGQRAKREQLERMEETLATLVKENKADVATVAQQVEKVENLRAEMNKTRMVMLYRINLLLTAEQRVKVDAIRARRDAERRKQPDASHRR